MEQRAMLYDIIPFERSYFETWVQMWCALEPQEDVRALVEEWRVQMDSDRFQTYLARNEQQTVIGFIDASIRYEYVDGAKHSPVGYIEGIYIVKPYRRQGIGRALIAKAEQWVGGRGCTEIGSDCDINNGTSEAFHRRLGYKEVYKSINFIKTLKQD